MARNVPFYSDRLGYVSAINESLGRMDAINTKDLNGNHSYGKWQIYGGGTMQQYLRSMAQMGGEHARIAARLNQFKVNSPEFDHQWKLEAQAHPDLLEQSQYQFIKATHYDPIVKGFNPELRNAINSNRGLQEALWQASVLGPGAARGLFNKGWKEGNGDIRKLVDVVYRDMHNYQQSYIRQNPTHLPILLKQHGASKGRVIDILNDSSRNRMVVGMPGQTVAPAQPVTGNSLGSETQVIGGVPANPETIAWDPEESFRNQMTTLPYRGDMTDFNALVQDLEQVPAWNPSEPPVMQTLTAPVQFGSNVPMRFQSPGKTRVLQLKQLDFLQPYSNLSTGN